MSLRSLSSESLGYYLPSFFFLKVNTDEPFDNLNILKVSSLSTLSHEYFHFLQDIFTTYGLVRITKTVDRLKAANNEIQNSNTDTFTIPFVASCDSVTQINMDLFSLYEGDSKCKITYNKITAIESEENGIICGYEKIPLIIVYVENTYTGLTSQFEFGSVCIVESMAFLLEDELFGVEQAPTVPYRTVEGVCNFIFPGICDNRKNLIALCDIALSHTHPASLLFELLNKLKDEPIEKITPSSLYKFANNTIRFQDNKYTFGDIYNYFVDKAIKSLTDYFTDDYYFPAANWARITLEKARNLRQIENFTFLEFAESKELGLKRLQRMIREIGTPLMANRKDMYYCLHPNTNSESQAPLYKAINEIHNVLFGYQVGCSLKNHCKKLPEGDITSHFCDTEPWLNSNKEQLCPFAQVWKMWGLDTKLPLRK